MRLWNQLTLLERFTFASAVIAVGLAVVLSTVTVRAIQAFAVKDEAQVAAELVLRSFSPQLRPGDFGDSLPAQRRALFDSVFLAHGISDRILRVRLWRADGRLLYSNVGEPNALRTVKADLTTPAGYKAFVQAREGLDDKAAPGIGRFFVPVRLAGATRVVGAFEIFHDLSLLEQRLADTRRTIWIAVPAGLFILYASVFVLVRRASRQLLKQQADIVAAHIGTYHALASALDAKDPTTGDHSIRVANLAVQVGRTLGLPPEMLEDIKMGARLHDLGKIAVPDAILTKAESLTPEEERRMRAHVDAGCSILQFAPLSAQVRQSVRHAHERWDGRGYPDRLKGEAIPLIARIITVVDAYEAMTSDRPYRKALPIREALAALRAGAGIQFDPDIVNAFVELVLSHEDYFATRTGNGHRSRAAQESIASTAVRPA